MSYNQQEHTLEYLRKENILSENEKISISSELRRKSFSLHWELRTLLYLGVVLLTTGLGILVYKNIDTIGHQALIAGLSLCCGFCFYYCFKRKLPYTNEQVASSSPFFDYVVLLSCLLFLILEGYLQFQFQLFGTSYGLAAFIPAVLFFYMAYIFDHKGVLSLGITSLAAWVGLALTPASLLSFNYFEESHLIYKALGLGALLLGAAYTFNLKRIKPHFCFTYFNFAAILLFTAAFAGLVSLDQKPLFFMLLMLTGGFYIYYARQEKSFYFLLLSVIYLYISITYLFFYWNINEGILFYYFVISCSGVIWFLTKYKKILKDDQSI